MDLAKIKGVSEWLRVRKDIEGAVSKTLGKIPRERLDLQVKVVDEFDCDGYTRRHINYFVDDWIRISAWVFVPEDYDSRAAILCCHRETHRGKDEPAGIDGQPLHAFARHYAELGYVTIAPDSITMGERVSPGLEPLDTAGFYRDYPKMAALAKMVSDYARAIDVLEEMREVDAARIGVIGHGLGASNALLLSALDDRVQACVASCGFSLMSEDSDPARWARDTGLVLVPKLKPAIAARTFPFDWDQVLALAAPSPLLVISAANDETLPESSSVETAVKRARSIYAYLGAENAIAHFQHRGGHQITAEALEAADDWFERWL